ncbi:DUF4124 domain-containing protein [Roseateles chitosanitabidus]|uniref:DUF4124 domain-containing protein n=1 Tax=Roseateles chitosanitabidus TaxID=65048 RepID=UPI0009FE1241|nr:DUF4124 domain-containing protein [Roseateles chitosanitabidus]
MRVPLLPVLMLSMGMSFGIGAQAEVWKCVVDGKVHYSDVPCPSKGEAMPSRTLQGNSVDASTDRARVAAMAAEADAAAEAERPSAMNRSPVAPTTPTNVCPSDRDIAGMETKASSISLSAEAKRFVQDEIRRARQCQKGRGQYTASDWNVSKQAVDAQSSLTGGADARRRAEAMHSAADAAEADRIARQQEAERREAARKAQWQQQRRDR